MAYHPDIPKAFTCLYENELKSIHASFAGSGDSGQIDSITAVNIDDEVVTEQELRAILIPDYTPKNLDDFGAWVDGRWHKRDFKLHPLTLFELFESVAYAELEARHGGWEINAGSRGTIDMLVPLTANGTPLPATAADISIDIEYGYDSDEEYDDEEEYNDE